LRLIFVTKRNINYVVAVDLHSWKEDAEIRILGHRARY
jgi:hypothetical protein